MSEGADELKVTCPKCQSHLAVPLPKSQNQSIPLTGRNRILWFMIGFACFAIMAVYLAATGGLDSTILLLTLPGIFVPLLIGQWKTRTFDAATHKLWEWVGKLSWLGLISMLALSFSVPLIFLVLGLSIIGVPFIALNIGTWMLARLRRKPTKILQVQPQ
ncbi:MAG: hypothetical protein UY55_C0005G0007 [Candidatus Jorgensenbacteria bacterium GW2011_GWB1_50_10]|uniref:Uncharacterized protein n=1 Tax=Candidatus Jorgensenbacteria bacterium GW2011_GWB1_50_10 TaxID=1618665 RepID=A0A0G1Z6W9_9BACT|nr:MAG: hypothetical protein UY55_C0005G0007 [Candidatus Jorgensenbacteria bacterium GW2011_GWB1_50_10]